MRMFYYGPYIVINSNLKNQTTSKVPAAARTKVLGCIFIKLCRAWRFEFKTMNMGTVDISQISFELNETGIPGPHLVEPF